MLHALAAVAFLVAVAGAAVGTRAAHAATRVDAPPPPGRRRLMALMGAALSALFALVIAASALAIAGLTCG